MAEYIKRSDVMKVCQDYSSHCFFTNDAKGQDIADRIENDVVAIPTADVKEVCKCGKCKHFIQSKEDECAGTCNHPMSGLSGRICKSDFCSYGERSSEKS